MHVFHNHRHNQFKNIVKKNIYEIFYKEVEKRKKIDNIDEWKEYKKTIYSIFKNAFPAIHDRLESFKRRPAGVDTGHPFTIPPNLIHRLDISFIKGFIKPFISGLNFIFIYH